MSAEVHCYKTAGIEQQLNILTSREETQAYRSNTPNGSKEKAPTRIRKNEYPKSPANVPAGSGLESESCSDYQETA